jgi:hypothetical protein
MLQLMLGRQAYLFEFEQDVVKCRSARPRIVTVASVCESWRQRRRRKRFEIGKNGVLTPADIG